MEEERQGKDKEDVVKDQEAEREEVDSANGCNTVGFQRNGL